jgi:hypothetical protein
MRNQTTFILPETTILKKLEGLKLGASDIIFSKSEQIAQARRTCEATFLNRATRIAIDFFETVSGKKDYSQSKTVPPMQHDFLTTGDDIRQAIAEYMSEHNITPESLGLNDNEKNSLIYYNPAPPSFKRFAPA